MVLVEVPQMLALVLFHALLDHMLLLVPNLIHFLMKQFVQSVQQVRILLQVQHNA